MASVTAGEARMHRTMVKATLEGSMFGTVLSVDIMSGDLLCLQGHSRDRVNMLLAAACVANAQRPNYTVHLNRLGPQAADGSALRGRWRTLRFNSTQTVVVQCLTPRTGIISGLDSGTDIGRAPRHSGKEMH